MAYACVRFHGSDVHRDYIIAHGAPFSNGRTSKSSWTKVESCRTSKPGWTVDENDPKAIAFVEKLLLEMDLVELEAEARAGVN